MIPFEWEYPQYRAITRERGSYVWIARLRELSAGHRVEYSIHIITTAF